MVMLHQSNNPPIPITQATSGKLSNHNEAHNSAIRRKCSAYRRRQNLYARKVQGLNRAITIQRLIRALG